MPGLSDNPECGNCPRVTPAARFTVEIDPVMGLGFNVLDAGGRLVKSFKSQAKAFEHAERLLEKNCPGGETFVACSTCPYLE